MRPLRLIAGGPYYYALRPDSDIGGELYERMLLGRLPEHDVDLVLALPRNHELRELPPGWQVDTLVHGPGLHWLGAPFAFTPWVVRLLSTGRVNLLRGHSVRYAGPALLAGRALARSSVPVVLHQHHLSTRWSGLEASILRQADAVVTVSQHSRRRLIEAGVRADRIHVVLQGVARPPVTDRREPWPGRGLRLLQLGRLEARKRPWLAIDTLAALRRSGIPASLIVAGEGPLMQDLRVRARQLSVAQDVQFAGRVSDAHKWRLYDSAEILLFGSTLEGFGVVVAEAQSRGVPVVAAAGTASAEALDPGRSGLLAKPGGEAFAACAATLADEPLRRAMAARAVEFAQRFDWDTCAAGVAAVYRNTVASRR